MIRNIIIRNDYKQVPPKVEYSLEPLGETLMPIIDSLKNWSVNYNKLYKKAVFEMEEVEIE